MQKIKTISYTNPKDPKDQRVVAHIDTSKKKVNYFVYSGAAQYRWIKKITVYGFDRIPAGFAKDGGGIAKGTGYLIVRALYDKLSDFDLSVSLNTKNGIEKRLGKYRVLLNYFDLRQALETLREIKSESYQALKDSASGYLNKTFPKIYPVVDLTANKFTYQKNQLAKILGKDSIFTNLSEKDIRAIIDFFPLFIKHYKNSLRGKKKLIGLLNSKEATNVLYLDKIIKEYERKIKAKVQNESNWQNFFRAYIQIFNPTYTTIFEKKNISLSGDFPDFVPIDIYGYLDIYEIKRPNTRLLVLDRSRQNYYWSSEMARAISQVENYIDSAVRLAPAIKESIKKYDNTDVKIVKPRGFIIVGTRSQLKGGKMEDDFKILSNSMKNIEIILFDDILNNLKSLFGRLEKK